MAIFDPAWQVLAEYCCKLQVITKSKRRMRRKVKRDLSLTEKTQAWVEIRYITIMSTLISTYTLTQTWHLDSVLCLVDACISHLIVKWVWFPPKTSKEMPSLWSGMLWGPSMLLVSTLFRWKPLILNFWKCFGLLVENDPKIENQS